MDRLIQNVAVVLKLREHTLTNKCTPSSPGDSLVVNGSLASAPVTRSTAPAEPPPVVCHSKQLFDIVIAVESLITHLVYVLSDGLWAGLDLWTVLVALERSPPQGSNNNRNRPANLQHLKVGSGMIHLIKSSFSTIPDPVKTRAFLRLALNQSCLLLVLEILAREFSPIVESYMMEHAVLAQYGSDKWDRFVAAIAPIAGPPLDVFTSSSSSSSSAQPATAGSRGGYSSNARLRADADSDDGASTSRFLALGGREVRGVASFDLDLIVPEFDFRLSYMNKLKMYFSGQLAERECPLPPIELVPRQEEEERRADGLVGQATKPSEVAGRQGDDRVQPTEAPATTSSTVPPPVATASEGTVTEPIPAITVDEEPPQPQQGDDGPVSASPARPTTKRIVKKVVVVKRVVKKSSSGTTVSVSSSSSFAGPSASSEGDAGPIATTSTVDVPVREPETSGSRDQAIALEAAVASAASDTCQGTEMRQSSPTALREDFRDTSTVLSTAASEIVEPSSLPIAPLCQDTIVVVVAERNPLVDEALNHLAALVEARRQYLQERIDSLRLQLLDDPSES